MRISIVTDAWFPQVNGVVVTLTHTIAGLERLGHRVDVISPEGFRSVPAPSYPEIALAILPGRVVARRLTVFDPDAVHIATEGPLGLAARRHCVRTGMPFTTAWHTQFPEYLHARWRVPIGLSYAWLRRFHRPAQAVLCGTPAVRDDLAARGFTRLELWSKGVDATRFTPASREPREHERPIFLHVGRLAVEKSVDDFANLALPGTKWIVGDGPLRAKLQREHPEIRFLGMLEGRDLVAAYQQADVFVFPSRTDTFGLVLLEAMACGTPVAAYPVRGPRDVVTDRQAGVLDDDLAKATLAALSLDRERVRRFAERFPWQSATRQFAAHLNPRRARPQMQTSYRSLSD
ncbi:MAG TPA: glycosyltransferase family 1 protein [Casimicrobiaceae bacterium]|nr:glycosyltransferase family 1 protein [Casimicrobiaceae bacterium]